ncbi:MAG: carbon monoxide dehydrogenase, partial [Pseudomonadota bacterium]
MQTTAVSTDHMRLTDRVVGFIDHLRDNGFTVGTQESGRIAAFLAAGPLPPLGTIRLQLKILLAGCKEEWQRFDDLFEAYWIASGRKRHSVKRTTSPHVKNPLRQAPLWRDHLDGQQDTADEGAPQVETDAAQERSGSASGRLVAATHTVDQKTDLKHIVDPDEIRAAEDLALRLARAMRYRLSRRHRTASDGRRLDLRRTIRRALPRGG